MVRLRENLEFPQGLWIKGSRIYYTETRGRGTDYGGAVRLSYYDLTTEQTVPVIDRPVNATSVVVSSSNKIYLAASAGSTPGEAGRVSVVDPVVGIESPVTDVPIAVTDMYITTTDDIYLVGSSRSGTAQSLLRLPAGNYANYSVVKIALGAAGALTLGNGYFYVAQTGSIQRFTAASDVERWGIGVAHSGLTSSLTHLYYVNANWAQVNRVDLATGSSEQTMADQLATPTNARYNDGMVFVVEGGTDAAIYADGRLSFFIAP